MVDGEPVSLLTINNARHVECRELARTEGHPHVIPGLAERIALAIKHPQKRAREMFRPGNIRISLAVSRNRRVL